MTDTFKDNGTRSATFDNDPRFFSLSNDEQKLILRYDTDGNGSLSFDEVVMLINDLKKLKSTNASLRRYLIACLVLVIVLSISNLGTAMAAAYLAKETKISSSGNLETMDGGAVSTVGRSGLVISGDMGNLHRDGDYIERRALSEQDGDLFLGCITDEMSAQIQASASSGSTVMVFDEIADGASMYHQLIGDGMSTDGKKAVYRCAFGDGGIIIKIDENGYCEESRRRLVERGLFPGGPSDMMMMNKYGHGAD